MAFTNPQGRTQTSLAEINIVPLVDVVLVLLIIFMLFCCWNRSFAVGFRGPRRHLVLA